MHKKSATLRSIGEAHLYLAIAKADGIVTQNERAGAPHYAQKSQAVFNVLKINTAVSKTIKHHVIDLFNNQAYITWSADQHLDEAITLFTQAKQHGDWGVNITFHQNKKGLHQVAFLDGYILKESQFLDKIEERLAALENI